MLMGRWSKPAAVFGCAATLIAGGGAYALASSSVATITVCVSHRGGTLYKARKCGKHDRSLSWNIQGRQGAPGAAGQQGASGTPGAQGVQGIPGPTTTLAPSGTTQRGTIYIDGYSSGTELGTSISFPLQLASAPTLDEVNDGSPDSHCQGTAASPTAAPGYLCIYIVHTQDVTTTGGLALQPQDPASLHGTGAAVFGLDLYALSAASGIEYLQATWAVTAP
jgi:hypothetical protein